MLWMTVSILSQYCFPFLCIVVVVVVIGFLAVDKHVNKWRELNRYCILMSVGLFRFRNNFEIFRYLLGFLRPESSLQKAPAYTGKYHTSFSEPGFERIIPVLECSKTVYVL
jgi:hypothetical protein